MTLQELAAFGRLFCFCAWLSACGGGGPIPSAQADGTPPTLPGSITSTVTINKPAGPLDGDNGGLYVLRSSVPGGRSGFVNKASYTRCIGSPGTLSFEWCNVALLDNYAPATDRSENVAQYARAVRWADGATWAQTVELSDASGLPGIAVAQEVDLWTQGKGTGSRIGIDLAVGDYRALNGQPTDRIAEGDVALRIGASSGSPYARWKTGVQVQADVPLRLNGVDVIVKDGQLIFSQGGNVAFVFDLTNKTINGRQL